MRTGRHLSKKKKPVHASWVELEGDTNNDGCSRHCHSIGSVFVPIKKTVQLYEQIQTQQREKNITRRHQLTGEKWQRNKTVRFPALFVDILICDTVTFFVIDLPKRLQLLSCFMWRSEGCLRARPQFPCDYQHLVWWPCVVKCARRQYSRMGNVH